MDEQNPRDDSEDISRKNDEDLVGASDADEFEEVEDAEEEDDNEEGIEE